MTLDEALSLLALFSHLQGKGWTCLTPPPKAKALEKKGVGGYGVTLRLCDLEQTAMPL